MHTKLVFTGLTGLALLAAVGCGSEQGKSESIGSGSSALTAFPGAARYAAGSCMLKDATTSKVYIVVAGGFDASGTPTNEVQAYEPEAAAWVGTGAGQPLNGKTLGTARGSLKGVTMASLDACLFMGGSATNGGAAVTYVAATTFNGDKLSVSNGVFTISHNAAEQLVTGRTNFGLTRCGTSNVMAVGGASNTGGATTYHSSVEVYNGTSWATVSTASPTLATARYDLALAPLDNTYSKFLIAGGLASGGRSAVMDTINVSSSSCSPSTDVLVKRLKDNTVNHLNLDLAAARDKAVAFPSGTSNQFLVAAGDEAAALASTVPSVTINDWSNSWGTRAAGPTTNFTATSNPVLVYTAAGVPTLTGGVDHAGTGTIAVEQKFSGGAWTNVGSLTDSRVLHVAEYLDTATAGKDGVYTTTGQKRSAGTTFLTSLEMWVP